MCGDFLFLCLYAERRDMRERVRPIAVMYIMSEERELLPLFLCRCRLTFICQSPIHKIKKTSLLWLHLELPWCNDKWALQRAPFNESMWKHEKISLASVTSDIWTQALWKLKLNSKHGFWPYVKWTALTNGTFYTVKSQFSWNLNSAMLVIQQVQCFLLYFWFTLTLLEDNMGFKILPRDVSTI